MHAHGTDAATAHGIVTVSIDGQYQGPDGIANGGYLAGRLGGRGPARIVLKSPARVGTPLQAVRTHFGMTLLDGGAKVATVDPCDAPDPVGWVPSAAEIADLPTPDLTAHPFPRCFVCGPDNDRGLRIVFRETWAGVAASFTPTSTASPETSPHIGIVGALDCSSGWAVYAPGEAGVLGTFEFVVLNEPEPNQTLTVVAERRERIGKRRLAASSVFDSNGALVGSALATWIDIPYGRRALLSGDASSVGTSTP